MAFSKEEISSMAPAEQKLAKELNAAEAAGLDPFAEPEETEEAEEAPAVDAKAEVEEPKAEEPKAEAKPEEKAEDKPADAKAEEAKAEEQPAQEEPGAKEPDQFVPKLQGKPPEKYDEQRKALRAEKSEARKKWSAGEIDDAEFDRIESGVEDRLEALQAEHLTARALDAANAQIKAQSETQVLQALARRAKGEGIDYADAKNAGRYDRALAMIEADPDFAGKSFADRAEEAHKTVLAIYGKTPAPAAAAAPVAAAPRVAPPAPKTLADLPAAATTTTGDSAREQLARATGKNADKLWNSLSPARQAELLGESL